MHLRKTLIVTALGLALGLPLAATAQAPAAATAPADANALDQKRVELERAERDLAEARRKVFELRRELGEPGPRGERREVRVVTAGDRAMVGVVFGEDANGVYVRAVTPGGGADKAGVRAGDRIVAINGKDVAAAAKTASGKPAVEAARDLVGRPKDGESVRLTVSRDGQRQELVATAQTRSVFEWSGDGEMPAMLRERLRGIEGLEAGEVDILVERALERAGHSREMAGRRVMMFHEGARDVRLAALNPELGKHFGADSGVLVLEQKNERFAPLVTGDVITSIGGERVESPIDVTRALRRREPGTTVNVEVVRDRKRQVLTMTVPERPSFEALWPTPPAPPAAPPAPPAPPAATAVDLPVPPAPPRPPVQTLAI
jgi:predicted metalloprotease with PDZ domain